MAELIKKGGWGKERRTLKACSAYAKPYIISSIRKSSNAFYMSLQSTCNYLTLAGPVSVHP